MGLLNLVDLVRKCGEISLVGHAELFYILVVAGDLRYRSSLSSTTLSTMSVHNVKIAVYWSTYYVPDIYIASFNLVT